MAVKQRRVNTNRFYRDVLTDAERSGLPAALDVEGVDAELAMLRVRLRSAIAEHPEDLALMLKGIELLARLVGMRYRLSKEETGKLNDSLLEGIREQATELIKAHGREGAAGQVEANDD